MNMTRRRKFAYGASLKIKQRRTMNPVYIPAKGFEEWRQLLAQENHWSPAHSATAIAEAWQDADGFPAPIAAILEKAGEPFSSLAPLLIFPEHKVSLPGGRSDSQNDVWVLASHERGLASITVEGKVSESFGDTLEKWRKDASPGKRQRLAFLLRTLGISREPPRTIRYQLLHRAVSALIEAERFHADTALMIVHSFSRRDAGLPDFRAFTRLFGVPSYPDEIVRLPRPSGIPLHVMWVRHPITLRTHNARPLGVPSLRRG
jgi:hypothetical protein